MPYRVDTTLLDLAGVFGATTPRISGTLSTTTTVDAAAPIAGAPSTSVLFPGPLSGPLPAAVVLSDSGAPTGQLFRSGRMTLPPSPGAVTVITAVGAIPASAVSGFAASLGGTQVSTPVEDWVKLLLGVFLGFGPPESVTIRSATITPGTGSLSLAITGSATYRLLFFIPFTQTFTISTTVTIAPSGDGTRPARIVSVSPAGTRLSFPVPTTFPLGSGGAVSLPFDVFNGTLTGALEPAINQAILAAVDGQLRSQSPPMRRTPTCVISARRVAITPAGISAQIMLGDFGGVISALPRSLSLSVSPAPEPGTQRTYTFRVADRADNSPVAGATVALTNRAPTSTQTRITDAQGRASFTTTLRSQRLGGGPEGEPRMLHPVAVATAPGATSATLVLTLIELA